MDRANGGGDGCGRKGWLLWLTNETKVRCREWKKVDCKNERQRQEMK